MAMAGVVAQPSGIRQVLERRGLVFSIVAQLMKNVVENAGSELEEARQFGTLAFGTAELGRRGESGRKWAGKRPEKGQKKA